MFLPENTFWFLNYKAIYKKALFALPAADMLHFLIFFISFSVSTARGVSGTSERTLLYAA